MAKVLTLEPGGHHKVLKKAQKLYEQDELDQAFVAVQDHLAEHPNDAQGLVLAAAILKRGEKTPIAYSLAKRATEIRPERSEPWVSLGHCAQHLWRLDEAISCYQKALDRATNDSHRSTYTNNMCSVYLDMGKFGEGEKWSRKSLEFKDDPLTRHNLGLSLLGQQKWREGWPYYSASVGTFNRLEQKYKRPPDEEPTWDGTEGKTVVVYGEQGIGDEVSFASMIPDLIKASKKVIVDCDKRLKGLFARSFPEATVYGTRYSKQLDWAEEDRELDYSISMGELGQYFRNETADFPGQPFLTPDPDRAAGWRAIFDAKEKPVIGIAWSGGTWNNGSKNRFLPLNEWGPIFKAIDAHWVSLQYKESENNVEGHDIAVYPWATLTKDYDDTAALVSQCDLVICMQTAVAHLAGGLGVPAWVMVPSNSQWRYGEATESLPWYNSLRIFKSEGDWGPVVKRISEELKHADIRGRSKSSKASGTKGRKGNRKAIG